MKIVSHYISRPLTYLCNLSMTKCVFPRELKVANAIPLFKAGNIMSVNNYRPVSILPVFSKIFEKHMFNRLSEYLKWKNMSCQPIWLLRKAFILHGTDNFCGSFVGGLGEG